MRTPLCDELGIEFPIFAFTHCRDVVAAVSRAGGFGVLGAVGFSPEQLEVELAWIDEHVGDHPYGVDIVIPGKYEGMDDADPEHLAQALRDMVPQQHLDFARDLLAERGVPELPEGESNSLQLLGWTAATATPQVTVALDHPKVALVANALGTPPAEVIERIHGAGRKVAALCGSPYQALKHTDAGVDIVIAQGGEGGGHTGEVGSVVLWPQVAQAIAPTPMLAAGGIGSGQQVAAALALGAQGVWAGSLWLTVEEADLPPAQQQQLLDATSRDTVRSRSFTGKPCRMIKTEWTEAWSAPDAPEPLPMPLQYMVSGDCVARSHRYADRALSVMFNPVGQVVGQMNRVERTSAVVQRLVEEYLEAVERLDRLTAAASA
ncbi:MAG TPA: nitronate monooxygenase family protein [Acidimicrobiales bacterium]|nr:nitronate monooxygenase family protein [Acidimicrobiales bacterium]